MNIEKVDAAKSEREELKELILSMTDDQFQTFIASALPILREAVFKDENEKPDSVNA